jgi:hypothetical protein
MLERKIAGYAPDQKPDHKIDMKEHYSAEEVVSLVSLARAGMLDIGDSVQYAPGRAPTMTFRDGPASGGLRMRSPFTHPNPELFKRLARVYQPNDAMRAFRVGGNRFEYQYQETLADGQQIAPAGNPRDSGALLTNVFIPAGDKRERTFSSSSAFFITFNPTRSEDGRLCQANVKLPALNLIWTMRVTDSEPPFAFLSKFVDIHATMYMRAFTLLPPLQQPVPPLYAPPSRSPLVNNAPSALVFKETTLNRSTGYAAEREEIAFAPMTHSFVADAEAHYLIEIGMHQQATVRWPWPDPETSQIALSAWTDVNLVSITTQKLVD